jgi:hypothetical protein
MGSNNIIKVTPDQLDQMIHDGIRNWFQLGLETLLTWNDSYYECLIVDQKKYMLAKINYGI